MRLAGCTCGMVDVRLMEVSIYHSNHVRGLGAYDKHAHEHSKRYHHHTVDGCYRIMHSGGVPRPRERVRRRTVLRGSVSVCILHIYPYHGNTGPGPVSRSLHTGASTCRGRRDGPGNKCHLGDDMGGKGVNIRVYSAARGSVKNI